ncbi:MAG: TIGR00341 family protein [Nitrospina sp.]|nr:TIGR00341 family protein [Nitrospina sp.]
MKIIEVIADESYIDSIKNIVEKNDAPDFWVVSSDREERKVVRILVKPEQRQIILDALQEILATSFSYRVVVIPVEAALPREEAEEETEITSATETTREELYNSIGKNARLNQTYLLLIFLSTVVVAIGLLKDNVAVVIGAMVIAPLLGPNLAMALGTALGDTDLMWKAFKTGLAGMSLALVLSIIIGVFWPLNIESRELLARTNVGLDSAVLAMASGAAAVISLTSGIPSILVGVMVAVALLPPAATMGLMLGAGQTDLAYGAAFLLAVNIVAINLSAKLGFLIQGIKPRTWLEKKKAKQSMQSYIIIWVLTLAALLLVIYFHPGFIN